MSTDERRFAVVPPNLLLMASTFMASAGIVAAAVMWAPGGRALMDHGWVLIIAITVLVMACLTPLRRSVTLQGRQLRIAAAIHTLRVPVEDLDVDHARIVDLTASEDDRPGMKTFGTTMPGYQAGHFKQLRGPKAFVLITNRNRVLILPERSGRRLMLSLEQPQQLIDALRRLVQQGRGA